MSRARFFPQLNRSTMQRVFFALVLSTLIGWILCGSALAMEPDEPRTDPKPEYYLPIFDSEGLRPATTTEEVATVLQTVALLTVLTLAPSILIMTTCFTRIVIVFGFLRRALATQTLPPDQVIVGLALFLTLFIMAPTWNEAWKGGIEPFLDGKISPETGRRLSQSEAFERVMLPQRRFMFACLYGNDGVEEVEFFMGISGRKAVDEQGREYFVGAMENGEPRRIYQSQGIEQRDIPTLVMMPAFLTAELRRAFWMGFLLYLPFLILDMVVASVLMSMGMMMLPPVMISLPFKIILFVLVDGWKLLMEGIVMSFPAELMQFADMVT